MRGRPAVPPPSVAVLIHNARLLIDSTVDIPLDSRRLLQRRDPEVRSRAIALFARSEIVFLRLISDEFWIKKNFNLLSSLCQVIILLKKLKLHRMIFSLGKNLLFSRNKFR